MSFGYYNNNNKVAVSDGTTVDSSFNKTYPNSTNTTGFMLNGVDICNYITEYAPGFQTTNNYGFSVNGININQKFSFNKPVLSIVGGTVSTDANYRYYTFTNSGNNLTITAPNFQAIKDALNTNPINIQILLVGGGGSGAQTNVDRTTQMAGAGGGAAGAFVTIEFNINGSRFNNNTIKFSPTIGAGGGVTTDNAPGNYGQISSVSIQLNSTHTVSAGGGEGGYALVNRWFDVYRRYNATLSGSSGGATATQLEANYSYQPGLASPNGATVDPASSVFTINSYQNNGGSAYTSSVVGEDTWYFRSTGGGGGGGAGGAGSSSPGGGGWYNDGGAGGAGRQWINGTYYAGGGGGADNSAEGGVVGTGGSGGGGGYSGASGGYQNGTANTGGGGSGGWAGTLTTGGSGVCIIAIPIASYNQYFV